MLRPVTTQGAEPRVSAYCWAPVPSFLSADGASVLGILAASHAFALEEDQRAAWEEEIEILRGALGGVDGTLFLEFHVPRLGSRIDAVLVAASAVFPIEFKCGARKYLPADYEQAWDYALDLKNFHRASHAADVFPLLVATAARAADDTWKVAHADGTRPPRCCTSEGLRQAMLDGLALVSGEPIDGETWGAAQYEPTPTIIEAARVLYARHTVEAISRNDAGAKNLSVTSGAVQQKVKPFIQNVHHFRDDGVRDPVAPPYDHVVIFDEAQRAWDRRKTADFMKRRKKILNFRQSEPEFLISYLDRHQEWAVIICLVGGGQEIHTGEAGIGEWLDAVRASFAHWQVHVAPNLVGSEYAAVAALSALEHERPIVRDERFHLTTSMRSFRSEHVSVFVKAVLDIDADGARRLHTELSRRYPIAVTRDLAQAKAWVRSHARGSERFGMVASSQAHRLKPHAIDVRVDVNPIHWFLSDRHDTRSSYYLEDAATEFQIQGLELDWICVTWDADLRLDQQGWRYHEFRGKTWNTIQKEERRRYLLNAYRVLLTRARQGMVIFVPPGESSDPTRKPTFYDQTYDYLRGLGLAEA